MKWFFIIIGSALLFTACLPMITKEEQSSENSNIDSRLAAGEITADEARFRRDVINKMANTYRFDMGSLQSIIGFLGLAMGGQAGLQRFLRGPSKPMDKESANVMLEMVRERKNGGTDTTITS